MKLHYRSNLLAGIVSVLGGIACLLIIPAQIGKDYAVTYGITSKTIPQAVAILWIVCGLVLIVQSLVFHKDTVKTLEVGKELKALLYMAVLVVYMLTFRHGFLISTILLGLITLALTGCKKPLYYGIVALTVVLLWLAFTYVLHVRLP
ncbi:MAG: tripartite tricarboxylate transporter TctB family protein [Clostridia bacterium]|nr:tripartite tricarboxylate transporter TctB family protein [Clostridia bacterium]